MKLAGIVGASMLAALMAMSAIAEEKAKETVAELKAEPVKRAKFIDFAGELGVSLGSLDSLGDRIDAARLASNPIEILLASKLLSAAETLSGKKAGVTSNQLVEEAIELAETRANPTEIATTGKLIGGDLGEKLEQSAKAVAEKK